MAKKKTKAKAKKKAVIKSKFRAKKTKRASLKHPKKVVRRKKVKPAKKKITKKKRVVAKRTVVKKSFIAKKKKEEVAKKRTKLIHAGKKHDKLAFPISPSRRIPSTSKKTKRIKFSFPLALGQVRDTVTDKKCTPPKPQVIVESDTYELQADHSKEVEHSPYVLDLKKGLTVFHTVAPKSKKKSCGPKQETFTLFDEQPTVNIIQEFKHFVRSVRNSLKPVKTINFAPVKNGLEPTRTAWRKWARLKWYWNSSFLGEYLAKSVNSFKARHLQRAIKLPSSLGALQIKPLSNKTRNGGAISSNDVQALLQRRRITKKENTEAVATFSEWLKKRQKRPAKVLIANLSWSRSLVPFAALCLILMLPFLGVSAFDTFRQAQGQVLGATDSAVRQLQEAKLEARQLDFIEASKRFDQAGQAFLAAGAVLDTQYGTTTKLLSFIPIIGKQVSAAQTLLDAGNELSQSASAISQGVAVFTDEDHFLADQSASHKLEYLFVHIQEARPAMAQAAAHLAEVDANDLPEDMRADVYALQQELPEMIAYVEQLDNMTEALLAFLGHDAMQRYLILFQNDTELRATGGFMGSLALVDIDRGEIEKIEVPGGGPYDFQGSFFEYYEAPRALQLINPRWELQDANWFFDWPLSAQKVSTFYEKAGGPSVDGLIAINTKVLEQLLEFTGPIMLETYDKEVSAENFRDILRNYVEYEYDLELNQPKKIIAELTPILIDRIKNLSPDQYIPLAQHLSDMLQEREILIYHQDEEVFNSFSELGWTGEVVQADMDYLGIVHTNLAGGKTDGVINDQFDLTVHISETGEIVNTLLIQREHMGEKGVPLIGVRNVDYLRVFVPEGSKLISAEGFEKPPQDLFEEPGENWIVDEDLSLSERTFVIHEESGTEVFTESGKTVFANWVQVDPGETVVIKLVYKTSEPLKTYSLPQKDDSWTDWFTGNTNAGVENLRVYRLYWQKQSGSWSPEISITVNYPQDWQVQSGVNFNAESGPGSWNVGAVMKGDSVWDLLFY